MDSIGYEEYGDIKWYGSNKATVTFKEVPVPENWRETGVVAPDFYYWAPGHNGSFDGELSYQMLEISPDDFEPGEAWSYEVSF